MTNFKKLTKSANSKPIKLSEDGPIFDNLISIEDVAKYLGKRPQTIRNMIAKRTFPFTRIGRTHYVPLSGFKRWLTKQEDNAWESR